MTIFDLIKQRVSICDVVSDYTALKKAGNYWKGRCPFHHEKTASFTVSPHKEIFYCFGCHVSGDVIAFVARADNLSQIEAARLLAERFSIELPEDGTKHAGPSTEQKERYFTIHTLVATWAHEQFLKSSAPRAYLEKRGFKPEIINQFMVGYFPGSTLGIKSLLLYSKQHNMLAEDLVEAHILGQNKHLLYSPFEERILFPINDALGRCCGFGGRIYKEGDSRPKYYNTQETDFFIKGFLLFGFDHAKKVMQKTNAVLLVEGYTDYLAMVQHGFPNTIATLGTACTQNHLKTVSRHVDILYILYDADAAGTNAVLRMTQLCWQVSMELRVVILPSGTDPASFLMAGNSLQKLIDDAPDIFVFYARTLGEAFVKGTLAKKIETIRILLEALSLLDDPLKRDLILYQASKAFDIPTTLLAAELRRIRTGKHSEPKTIETEPASTMPEPTLLEKKLTCAILNRADILDMRSIQYLITYMPQPFTAYIQAIVALCDQGVTDPFKQFFSQQAPGVQKAVSKIVCSSEPETDPRMVQLLFEQWYRQQWKRIVADLKEKIAQATIHGDTQAVQNLLHEFNSLRQTTVSAPLSKDSKRDMETV